MSHILAALPDGGTFSFPLHNQTEGRIKGRPKRSRAVLRADETAVPFFTHRKAIEKLEKVPR
jgi:hypothetical protein